MDKFNYIFKDGIRYVAVNDVKDTLLTMKEKTNKGVEAGYIESDSSVIAVRVAALNFLSYILDKMERKEVDGLECYEVEKLIGQCRDLKREILEGKLAWCWNPDQKMRTHSALAINKFSAKVNAWKSEDELRARNMFPLEVAVPEYKAGIREVKMPPRYGIAAINDGDVKYYADEYNGAIVQTFSPKLASMYVTEDDAADRIRALNCMGGSDEWAVVDLIQIVHPRHRFLRQLFGVDEGLITD